MLCNSRQPKITLINTVWLVAARHGTTARRFNIRDGQGGKVAMDASDSYGQRQQYVFMESGVRLVGIDIVFAVYLIE